MEFSYVPPDRIVGDSAYIQDGDEQKHLTRALRKKPGDSVHFVDGEGWIYEGVLIRVKPVVEIKILDRRKDYEAEPAEVTLAPALLKGTRLDTVVEKATELGVANIIPMSSSRTVAGGGEPGGRRLERWRRIALSAMKQSLRARLPGIVPVMSLQEIVGTASSYDLALIASEEERGMNRGLASAVDGKARRVLLMVGPEGGFEREEIALAREAGMRTVSLGSSRLRSDTASIAGMALLMAALDAA